MIIEANRDVIEGQRILDLASHDRRFSLAAFRYGATHFIGIEARAHLVTSAIENMKHYGIRGNRYSFVVDYHFAPMRKFRPRQFNTVLCARFTYHTYQQEELLNEITPLMPITLIVDSKINTSWKPVVEVYQDSTNIDWEAIDDRMLNRNTVIIGWPSRSALEMMLKRFGFNVSYFDWGELAQDRDPHVTIYRKGRRVTIRCMDKHP